VRCIFICWKMFVFSMFDCKLSLVQYDCVLSASVSSNFTVCDVLLEREFF
jgi:hypothetical protein